MKKGFAPILLILVLLGLTLFSGGIAIFISKNTNNKFITNSPNITTTSTPTSNNNSDKAIIQPINLNDKETVIYYGEGKSLYRYMLDGEPAKKVLDFEDFIVKVKFVPFTKDLFIKTLKYGPKKSNVWLGGETKDFLIKENSNKPDLIIDDTGEAIRMEGSENAVMAKKLELTTRNEYIYPERNGSSINIMEDKLDGSYPKKIGSLKINKNEYPGFTPSYSGEYLLNNLTIPQTGREGTPAVVISKDGTKEYPIKFYWPSSFIVWISGNQLLTSDRDGEKLFTFKPDGTFKEENAPYMLGGICVNSDSPYEGNQKCVSPSNEYLVINHSLQKDMNEMPKLELLNLKDKSKIILDQFNSKISVNQLWLLGWNSNSTKILYQYSQFAIFDLKTMKNYKFSRGLGNISPNLIDIY